MPPSSAGAKANADALTTERFTFASQKRSDGGLERVPVLVVRPEKAGRFPVMIVLHGTGGSKDGMKSWLTDFAKAACRRRD